MNNQNDRKRLERKAKAMLMDKDIPPAKMEIVRSLMNNNSLDSGERYRAIIELIQNCEDKSYSISSRRPETVQSRRRTKPENFTDDDPESSPFSPTETSYYIDDLYAKYRDLKLLKKRYFVHRENRFGIGFRKRLIPSKRLLNAFRIIKDYQSRVSARLGSVMHGILNDPEVSDPVAYNYLKLLRRWLSETPFADNTFDVIKWMERRQFEREFRNYAAGYLSFLMTAADEKERIYASIEYQLRSEAERNGSYKSPDKAASATESIRRIIDEVKSFLPLSIKEVSPLDERLKTGFGARYYDITIMVLEALCFQRLVSREELLVFYSIKAPAVSREKWDCTEGMLVNAGKDPESRLRREHESLTLRDEELSVFRSALGYSIDGGAPLLRAADEQWKYADKKNYDAASVYEENYISFIQCLINYFQGVYLYFLNGGIISLKSPQGQSVESPVFDGGWFSVFSSDFSALLDEIHFFRTNNPSLVLTRIEIKKIFDGRINTMDHVAALIKKTGDLFYRIGKELCILTAFGNHAATAREPVPVKRGADLPEKSGADGLAGWTISEIPVQGMIMKRFNGMPVVTDWSSNAFINEAAAFCCLTALECLNPEILSIMSEQRTVSARIEEIEKKLMKING